MSNETGNQGIIMSGGSLSADQLAVGQQAQVSGTVIKTINQLQDSDAPDAPQLAELLKQLQAAIEADPNLNAEDKTEALGQLNTIAEAGKNPKDQGMQNMAKKAMRMLKGIIAELPTATTLVEQSTKLFPVIAKLFALGV